jgi:hypothetical protein
MEKNLNISTYKTNNFNNMFAVTSNNKHDIYFYSNYYGLGKFNIVNKEYKLYNESKNISPQPSECITFEIVYIKHYDKLMYFLEDNIIMTFSCKHKSFHKNVINEIGNTLKVLNNKYIVYVGNDSKNIYINLSDTGLNCPNSLYDIDNKNNIWFVSNNNKLYVYNYKTKTKELVELNSSYVLSYSIKCTKNYTYVGYSCGDRIGIVSVNNRTLKSKIYEFSSDINISIENISTMNIYGLNNIKDVWVLCNTKNDNDPDYKSYTYVITYSFISKKFKLRKTINDTTNNHSIIFNNRLYTYVYNDPYIYDGSNPDIDYVTYADQNKKIMIVKNKNTHIHSYEIFTNDDIYEFHRTDINKNLIDSCIDGFITINNKVYFYTSYKEPLSITDNKKINFNSINLIN